MGRSSALMAAGTLVSRILGFVRNALFASVVGISLAGEAFNVANTMPNYLLTVLNAGILQAVLIPQITAAMKKEDGGQEFIDKLLTAAFGAILVVALLGTAVSPWLIQWTSDLRGAALRLSIVFGFICMPQILFYGLYSVLGNVLNARDRFAAFMWAPALANVVQIAGLTAFLVQWGQQKDPAAWTAAMIWTLAGSTTLSIAAQAFILVPPLVSSGFRYRPRFGLRGSGLGAASKMVGWTVTALLIALGGGFVVQWVLTSAATRATAGGPPVGGITAYNYAMLVFTLPHGLVTVSIITALFPQLTRAWQGGDLGQMRRLLARALSMPAVLIVPASIAILVLAGPIVHVLLQLSPRDAQPVVLALQIMSFGILGYGYSVLQQRYCFAREAGRENLAYQSFLTAIQVAFALGALWLAPVHWVLPLVALGLVIGNWAQSLLFIAIARRQMGGLALAGVVRLWTRLLIASVLGGATAWLVVRAMSGLGRAWGLSLATCALAGMAFGLVYLAVSKLLHIREVDEVFGPVLRRLRIAR
ncbi:murein biosynthesis integral membrane protein MurJ [Luteococcus sp. OSA5]|uniref:murein biosynthesis integral membrane protein MurJ n=1 Tax=Luteococcus sp. OSA5 TaxID=3401630 RepID=UPI003B42C544